MSLTQVLLLFSLFGAIQGFLIAFLLTWQSRLRTLKDVLLVALFLGASVAVLLVSMVNSNFVVEGALIRGIEGIINLSVGTIFLHFVVLSLAIQYRTTWYGFLYVPALVYLFYFMVQFSSDKAIFWLDELFLCYFQFNIFIAGLLYFKFRENKNDKAFDWAGLLLLLFFIVIVSQWLRYLLPNRLPFKMIIPFTLTLGFWGITLYGFLQSIAGTGTSSRTTKTAFRQAPQLMRRLEHLMREEEVYLNPDLTQHQLASRMELHPNQLSRLFREHFQVSFNQYINGYRIKRAREMLLDPAFDYLSVEGIGLEAGFKSRSVFYRAFKEMVGQTPAAFRLASRVQ